MKKIILGIAALAMFAVSCKSDKSEIVTPEPKQADWYITGAVSHPIVNGAATQDTDSLLYTYNADKTVNTLEEFNVGTETGYAFYSFVYDQGKLTKLTAKYSKTGATETLKEFRYSGANLVRMFNPGEAATNYDSLVYDNNKLIKFVTISNGNANRTLEYTWENNNVTVEKEYKPDANTHEMVILYTRKYTYNEVTNPFKSLALVYYLLGDQTDGANHLSAHEMTARERSTPTGTTSNFYTITREQNDKKLTISDTSWLKVLATDPNKAQYITTYKYIDLNK